jgi:hypothetical protein
MNTVCYVSISVFVKNLNFELPRLGHFALIGDATGRAIELFGIGEKPKVFQLKEDGLLVPAVPPEGMAVINYCCQVDGATSNAEDLKTRGRIYPGLSVDHVTQIVRGLKIAVEVEDEDGNSVTMESIIFDSELNMRFLSFWRRYEGMKKANGGH